MPVNPEWPLERIKFIIEQSGCEICVIEKKLLASVAEELKKYNLSLTEIPFNESFSILKIQNQKKNFPPELTYLLFTSGSTGFPKGIAHCSESVAAFLKWCSKEFDKYKLKRFVSIAPFNFDLSVFDIFYPLMKGASLYVPDQLTVANTRLFSNYLASRKIQVIYTTPSYLNLFLQTGQPEKRNLNSVKLVLIAGEALTRSLVSDLKKYFKKAVFYNLYGPTETNVCMFHKVNISDKNHNVPIGKSCYPREISVSKDEELIYKGRLLMKAFINEKGIHKIKKGALYRTGDIVQKAQAGEYEFVRRKDSMIKRNGFRIELNEIKRVLSSCEGVNNCEVLKMNNDKGEIIAFVETHENLSELSLKKACLDKLPSYMLPNRIIPVFEFPLNLNHKVDVNRLKENYL